MSSIVSIRFQHTYVDPSRDKMTGDAAKPKAASTGPKTLDMVRAAIEANSDRKGTSVPAIKSYIIGHYPDVDPQRLKFRLKKAIEKGFESGLLCRPKSSEFTGESVELNLTTKTTMKPVCNDHLSNKICYLWFIQWCVLTKTEGTNLLLLTISVFWSSSRWPLAT